MATAEAVPRYSALMRRLRTNSTALAESSPRVELSQHCKGAPDKAASQIVTRLRLRVSRNKIRHQRNLLSTRDTPDKVITHDGVDCMQDTEHSHDGVPVMLCVLSLTETSWWVARGSSFGSKSLHQRVVVTRWYHLRKSLADCKLRKVFVDFSSVNCLASELRAHLFRGDPYG